MECEDIQYLLLHPEKNLNSQKIQQIQNHIAGCDKCRTQFQILDIAITDKECDYFSEMMPMYIDTLLDGDDVKTLYPNLHKHLQTCSDCQATVDQLYDLLLAKKENRLVKPNHIPEPVLPFIKQEEIEQKQQNENAWSIKKTISRLGDPITNIRINYQFINNLLFPEHSDLAYRFQESSTIDPKVYALVDDLLGVDQATMLNIELREGKNIDGEKDIQLRVTLSGPEALGTKKVTVTYGEIILSQNIDSAGQALFTNISESMRLNAQKLKLKQDFTIKLHHLKSNSEEYSI